MPTVSRLAGFCLFLVLLVGCAGTDSATSSSEGADSGYDDATRENMRQGTYNDAFESSYEPLPATPTLIQNATIMTAAGKTIEGGDLLMRDRQIDTLGTDLAVPDEARVVDGDGMYVTPGLIDSHSHLGVSATPEVGPHYDNNEAGMATPQLWMEHGVWPQGPGFARALAGGTTTALLLPGSGDLIEGRGFTAKLIPARTPQDMKFPDAPGTLKMACGENPKGGAGFPTTRMGTANGLRRTFLDAQAYRKTWDAWLSDPTGEPPERDLGMETLAQVLRGDMLVQVHCYRADDMTTVMEIAQEFEFDIRSFHHAVEAYKIRDLLATADISASMWSNWWGFKMEAFDGIPENVPLVHDAGARAIVHSDDDLEIQRLHHEAAKALRAGREAGLTISRNEALRWVTAHPAWALGIQDRIGTLEPGKNADVVLWTGDPFSVYTKAQRVWMDGALVYDRTDPNRQPQSDFELGGPVQN
ncbi:MAG: amidohydrolase family protein [Salinibacter sp.]|uniref:amidohydrolase family protein n=1 Tax=Salinibacter sp. TaxID=2065818 RepID=UPI002FC29D87